MDKCPIADMTEAYYDELDKQDAAEEEEVDLARDYIPPPYKPIDWEALKAELLKIGGDNTYNREFIRKMFP